MKYVKWAPPEVSGRCIKNNKIYQANGENVWDVLLEYVYRALPKVIEQRCIKTNFVHKANVEALVSYKYRQKGEMPM